MPRQTERTQQPPEFFSYTCPNCAHVRNATDVVKELPREVLLPQTQGLISSLRRKRHAGPGRPRLAHCPGCSQEMPALELKDHRTPCVIAELKKLEGWGILLYPKDVDPYPTFRLHHVNATDAEFLKISNQNAVTIDLRKIAEITLDKAENVAHIRVLGRVAWFDDVKRWRFVASAIGRPPVPRLP